MADSAEAEDGGRGCVAVVVGEVDAVGRGAGAVSAAAGGELLLRGAVKFDGPEIVFEGGAFVGDVEDGAGFCVDAVYGFNFVVTLSELAGECGVGGEGMVFVVAVEVEVGMAVAPAGDEEASAGKDVEVGAEVEVFGVGVGVDEARFAGFCVGEVEVEVLLVAGEDFDVDGVGVNPAEAGDVVVVGAERDVDELGFAAFGGDDADADGGVGVTGLGVALVVDGGVGGDPVGDGILGDFGLIHLEVGDGFGVGRPEVVAADVELFEVDPVDFAVEEGVGGVVGEGGLSACGGDGVDVEIVVVEVGDVGGVGGEFGIVAGAFVGVNDEGSGAGGDVVEPEVATIVDEEMLGVGGPDVGGHAVTGAVVCIFFVDGGGGEFAKLLGCGEDAGAAGCGVDLDDVAGFTGSGRFGLVDDEGEELAVGAPVDAVGGATGEVFVRVGDGADAGVSGEWCRGWWLRGRLAEGRSYGEAEKEGAAEVSEHGWVECTRCGGGGAAIVPVCHKYGRF